MTTPLRSDAAAASAGPSPVLVIGGGLAGCTAARALADAGHPVTVLEKSRGLGGRMATRRVTLPLAADPGAAVTFDHGTPAFTARSRGFELAVQEMAARGVASPWAPPLAEGSYRDLDNVTRWVATPDLPAWCRALAAPAAGSSPPGEGPSSPAEGPSPPPAPIDVRAQHRVDRLERRGTQWHVQGVQAGIPGGSSAAAAAEASFELSAPLLLVTAPAPQSAALLAPHRPEWASRARSVPMQPTWTLMAVADGVEAERLPPWGLARPQRGPLAWVLRQDSRPGRAPLPGAVAFVAHATVDWSITHLEAEPDRVQALLLDALAAWTGPLPWRHAMVHRWRYATVERAAAQQPGLGLFDAATGLAVAGDWLGGGGVEGAWLSGRAMAAALRDLGGPAA
jgi:hypothetical protein